MLYQYVADEIVLTEPVDITRTNVQHQLMIAAEDELLVSLFHARYSNRLYLSKSNLISILAAHQIIYQLI